jgi:hypothetical protein
MGMTIETVRRVMMVLLVLVVGGLLVYGACSPRLLLV